jgi:hypothetical protein
VVPDGVTVVVFVDGFVPAAVVVDGGGVAPDIVVSEPGVAEGFAFVAAVVSVAAAGGGVAPDMAVSVAGALVTELGAVNAVLSVPTALFVVSVADVPGVVVT